MKHQQGLRIGMNTVFMAVRTFVLMLTGLYVSRAVLDLIGAVDYGIYSLVAGVVGTMMWLNSAIAEASKRFAAFALGQGDVHRQKAVFAMSMRLHAMVAAVVVLVMLTAGLWYVNRFAVIPEERMAVAQIAFICALAVAVMKILSMPYEAAVIAHEEMQCYVYVSMADLAAKVLMVWFMRHSEADGLMLYAIGLMVVELIVMGFYVFFARSRYAETAFPKRIALDPILVKEMLAYGGWNMVGHAGFTLKSSGIPLVLNAFCGPAANAAMSIAHSISGGVLTLAGCLKHALGPQITKRYAASDGKQAMRLTGIGMLLTAVLLLVVCLPMEWLLEPILRIWLVDVPPLTLEFARISLLTAMVISVGSVLDLIVHASGQLKYYYLALTILNSISIPAAYGLLRMGLPPYIVEVVLLGVGILQIPTKLWIVYHYIPVRE